MKKDQDGFGVLEIVLVIVVIAILGVLGWVAYGQLHKTDNSSTKSMMSDSTGKSTKTSKTATTNDPYSGWSTYKSIYSSAAIRYPSDWTLQLTKDEGTKFENAILISPEGSDSLTFAIDILVNDPTQGTSGSPVTSYGTTDFNGKYIVFYSDTQESSPSAFTISSSNVATGQVSSDFLYSQYSKSDNTRVLVSGELSNREDGQNPQFNHPVSDIKGQAYWPEAEKILSSFSV